MATVELEGSLRSLRKSNRERLLLLLRDHGALHRAELARRSGLSRSTVSTIVAQLLVDGLVVRSSNKGGVSQHQDGRAGEMLTLNPAAGAALGMDFSYKRVQVVLADLAHRVLAEAASNLVPEQGWAESLAVGESLVERVLAEAGFNRSQVVGAGLGVPGPIDQTRGEVGASSNSQGWVGVHAAEELSRRLGVPVGLDNTSHLGSLAEVMWGGAQGCRNVVYLKISTGVGAGLMLDGQVFRGAIGAAGEIGHITVDESGPACRCGNRGCLEVYASVPAVLAALAPAMGDNVSVPTVLAAAAEGNRACRRVLGDVGRVVGRAMASVCNLLNLDQIIVGGELTPAGEVLLDPIREALDRHALAITARCVEVVPAQLGEQAGALGGVALVLREGQRLVSGNSV